jgi:hypothetical protein
VINKLSTTPWGHMGEQRYSSTILDLTTRWRWVVSFMRLPPYSRGKIPRYPLDIRLVGPKAGLDAVEWRKVSSPCQEMNPSPPTCSTSLYRLSYPSFCPGVYDMWKLEFCLLGHNATYSAESQPTYRRNMSLPFSESKNKPSKKPAWSSILLPFDWLYEVLFQMIQLLIATAERTWSSNSSQSHNQLTSPTYLT